MTNRLDVYELGQDRSRVGKDEGKLTCLTKSPVKTAMKLSTACDYLALDKYSLKSKHMKPSGQFLGYPFGAGPGC